MSDNEALKARLRELEYENCFVPQESSSSEEEETTNHDEFIEANFVPPQVRMAQKVLGKKKKEATASELISRADFEMPDLYERLKMYMKMMFDFVRTHPKIKGKDNERNFSFVMRRAINVLNEVVRIVDPTGNYIVIDKEEGVKYSKMWIRLVKIISYMMDYDGAFEILAKTFAYYGKKPVRHNYSTNSLRSLTSVFFSSTPTLATRPTPAPAPTPEADPAAETFKPKLSEIEFAEINKKLIALHEFLVGASADRMKQVDMTRFNESAENDPWVHKGKKPF